jgi:hypothetical protein
VAVRAPHLYRALRCFCLAGFSILAADVEAGDDIPFAFEEHAAGGGSAPLYEYRPLLRSYVDARAQRIAALADARIALEELSREPAAAVYASAHAGKVGATGDEALLRTVLLPLLADVAEAAGGIDWADDSFARVYAAFERTLFGKRRTYAAVAPLTGLSASVRLELGEGLCVRPAAAGELAAHWPEASGLLPPAFGREPDRLCVLELERTLATRDEAPDAAAEIADVVSALRLATSAPVAAGPVLFERLDWKPLGIRPVLPIAATVPPGEPTRLDAFRSRLAADLLTRLGRAEDDPELAEALDRWELSLFADEPFRSEQLREALTALLGGLDGVWAGAVRAAVLLGTTGRERAAALETLQGLARGEAAGTATADLVRKALVETLAHGDRSALIESLDEALLGIRPRPAGYFAAVASAS